MKGSGVDAVDPHWTFVRRSRRWRTIELCWAVVRVVAVIATATVAASIAFAQGETMETPRIAACQVGFAGSYKVGFMTPVWVELEGAGDHSSHAVDIIVPDNDGVPTAVRAEVPESINPEGGRLRRLGVTKFGKIDAPLTVRLRSGGKVIASRTFDPSATREDARIPTALPAVSKLLVKIGAADLGLSTAISDRDESGQLIPRRVVSVADLSALPTDWRGYDGVDRLVISPEADLNLDEITDDDPRMVAVRRWVEMGGRLLLFCGADAAELMLPSGPLSELVPGRFDEIILLDRTRAIEIYSESEIAVPDAGQRFELRVPRIADVRGNIECYEGSLPADLPLVVRAPLGFGEVVFVALDVSQEPLASWRGRSELIKTLLDADAQFIDSPPSMSQSLTTRNYNDLAAALRHRLGREFEGVSIVSFGWVAFVVVGYLLLIGPLDYLFVQKVCRRMEWTWVTFPLIVLLVCAGAYQYALTLKGDQLRTNLAQLVDFDMQSRQVRGTVWASLYSPTATTYNLSLQPHWLDGSAVAAPETQLSWMGRPGAGLGGMQSGAELTTFGSEYRIATDPGRIEQLPVQVWSTKTITGRWHAALERDLAAADLTATGDGLVEGEVRNISGKQLRDARLFFGDWAWRLGDVPNGDSVTIDYRRDPRKVTTLLTREIRTALPAQSPGPARSVFVPGQASISQLLDLMSFYEAAGGYGFARLWNQLQPFCDLSHLLEQDLAILIANAERPGSELLNDEKPIRTEAEQHWVLYRFILPVKPKPY